MEFFQVNIFFVNQANKLNHFKMSNFTHFSSNISTYENNHVTLNNYTKWHNLIIHTIETYIKTLVNGHILEHQTVASCWRNI
jgi:hypothetical protein